MADIWHIQAGYGSFWFIWMGSRLRYMILTPQNRLRQTDTWVDADEDIVYIKDICLFGACDGFHPYLRFLNNPQCPCHVPRPLTKRPLAAPPAPNSLHPVPTHAPTHGCGYDSDSDRWYDPRTESWNDY